MARFAERHEVVLVMRSAARERQDVMYLRGGRGLSMRQALRAQRVRREEPRANLLPLIPVALLRCRVAFVAVVVRGDLLLVLRAILPVG